MTKEHAHFQNKDALQHVIDARLKGKMASEEMHGTELAGHYSAAADAAKETAFILLMLWMFFHEIALESLVFLLGFVIWKVGRSAILGYNRLSRFHRLIEEERWEIEHHREQEREELTALYAAKGFSGKLLEEAIDVLMADDNRLLQVMLEEELGLNLESYEHPLKQACGALVGVFGAAVIMSFGLLVLPWWGTMAMAAVIIALSAGTTAQLERASPIHSIIWNLGVAALASCVAFFASELVL